MIILFSMLKRVKYYMYMTTSLLVTDMVLYYIYYCGDDPEATDEIDGCRAMSR